MQEFLQVAFSPENAFYSVLLCLVLFYWLSVFAGLLSINGLDFDVDVDADIDLDLEVDADADFGADGGWFTPAMEFFHIGRVPLIIIISFSSLSMWFVSMWVQAQFGPSMWLALALFFPNLILGLFLTKFITLPMVPLFDRMDAGVEEVDYTGRFGKLVMSLDPQEVGQAEVILEDDSPLLIRVQQKPDGSEPLSRGTEVVILSPKSRGSNIYWVRKATF